MYKWLPNPNPDPDPDPDPDLAAAEEKITAFFSLVLHWP